jgi:TonB family protein
MRTLLIALLFSAAAVAQDAQPCSGNENRDCIVVPSVNKQVEAKYTKEAQKADVEGVVLLRCTVGRDGRATDIKVLHSLGYGLDENAVKSLRKWKFKPATLNGKPLPYTISVETVFTRQP